MSSSLRNILLFCGAASGIAIPAASTAATTATTFTVSTTISPACSLAATDLAFGPYDPSSASALDGSSTISVYCTSGTSYTLSLDVGTGGGAYTARNMANGADTLDYNLYTSAARTTVWGDGSGSTGTLSGTGAGLLTADDHTVYGRIVAQQDRPAGTYSSTITVTVTFQ